MVSTIHIKISQNLSPGRGVGRFLFWGGGGVSNGFQKERGGESVVANWVQRWDYVNLQPMRENYQNTTKAEGESGRFCCDTSKINPNNPSPLPLPQSPSLIS